MKFLVFCFTIISGLAIAREPLKYTVSMDDPGSHTFHISVEYKPEKADSLLLKMPDWTPGYYQLMDYASNVQNFTPKDEKDNALQWVRSGKTGWTIAIKDIKQVSLDYDVKTTRQFVATSYLDEGHGYIIPASIFMYVSGKIDLPSEVIVKPYKDWNRVATGLDSVKNEKFTYLAPDFDILYDSPILVGNLEELPPFYVKGIPHRFIGYKLGDFDKADSWLIFRRSLKKHRH